MTNIIDGFVKLPMMIKRQLNIMNWHNTYMYVWSFSFTLFFSFQQIPQVPQEAQKEDIDRNRVRQMCPMLQFNLPAVCHILKFCLLSEIERCKDQICTESNNSFKLTKYESSSKEISLHTPTNNQVTDKFFTMLLLGPGQKACKDQVCPQCCKIFKQINKLHDHIKVV